jgi:hypothetical protein
MLLPLAFCHCRVRFYVLPPSCRIIDTSQRTTMWVIISLANFDFRNHFYT